LRIVGPAWDTTRYAGGTWSGGRMTRLGRALLDVMAEFNVILDASHLSHQALFEALDAFEGRHVIASHSNPHRFVPTSRHLPDKAIEMIAERGGVIGVVLYNRFLKKEWSGKKDDVTLDDVVRMIDHICQVTGSADHVGLGSDYDGGFGAEAIPRELNTIRDHFKIGDELLQRGFEPKHVEQIMGGNWLRILREALPT
jgi:membrane dipeptidase